MRPTEVTPGSIQFKHYIRTKQAIAHEIRTLREFLKENVGEREAEVCRQLMTRLAEDRFTLAVVGQFKRGKSSLMNAIIGRELLPTGVLPLTSAITVLRYGPKEKLIIYKERSNYPEEVSLFRLAEYVTEKGNPGNFKNLARACLELRLQFLRSGLEFVDTPGIGSAIAANTFTTLSFIPQSDAVVFVTSVDTPLTEAETDFLRAIRKHVRKIFFVINKIDLVQEAEKQEILQFVTETLQRQMGSDEVKIFPTSSTLGLSSKLAGREEDYARSGVRALQEALSDFLTGEKNNALLVSILDKVLRLATEASRGLNLLKVAGEIPPEELNGRLPALNARFQALREARHRLVEEVADRLLPQTELLVFPEAEAFLAKQLRRLLEELDNILTRSRWRFSCKMLQEFSRNALSESIKDLELWAGGEMTRVEPLCVEMLRKEWEKMLEELGRIPLAAGEVLGVPDVELPSQMVNPEHPIHSLLMQQGFTNFQGTPKVPVFLACLPVFMVQPVLRKHVNIEIHRLMDSFLLRFKSSLSDGVREALRRTASELEARAAEMESRIVQAMKGKRLSKRIDGRWQLAELDSTGLSSAIETLAGIEKKLLTLRSEMLQVNPTPLGEETASVSSEMPAEESPDTSSPTSAPSHWKETGTHAAADFPGDLSTRGCPVCNCMIEAAFDFFAGWQYALAMQEKAQKLHATTLGFCPLHTWQLAGLASPSGLSKGYPDLMERLAVDLSHLAAAEEADQGKSLRALVPTPDSCRVCHLQKEVEGSYLKELVKFVQTPDGRKAYGDSQGLCLPHLAMLATIATSGETVRFCLELAARRFTEISEDMQNFAMKHDAMRAPSLNLDEMDAYIRGLVHSVGEKKLCSPWELDAEV